MKKNKYSIWLAWKEIPLGWKQVGPKRSKEEVLKYVKRYGLIWDQKALESKWIKMLLLISAWTKTLFFYKFQFGFVWAFSLSQHFVILVKVCDEHKLIWGVIQILDEWDGCFFRDLTSTKLGCYRNIQALSFYFTTLFLLH